MGRLITHLDQITPDWLTEILSSAGVLNAGEVLAIHTEHDIGVGGGTSVSSGITVDYSPSAPDTAPRQLFIKFGSRKPEVDFFHYLAPTLTTMPILHCYDAVYEDGQAHLLFDDLRATHGPNRETLPLPVPILKHLIDIIVPLHVRFWEDPAIQGEYQPILDNVPGFILGQAQAHFAEFVDVLGDRLPPKFSRYYEKILAAMPLPEWQARLANNRQMTLVHGDTHDHNFLFPHDSNGDIYLIDWAVWHRQVGTFDIAYMLLERAERRAYIEESLVRYYHEQLVAQGITGYDWSQCWHDYKLAVIGITPFNIFWFKYGTPAYIWYHTLYDSMAAFEDLHCEDLLV